MATSARPVAPSKRQGRGRANKPQRAGPSKVSARGLSFGVPSSGSPGAASFSAAAAADASAKASALSRYGRALVCQCPAHSLPRRRRLQANTPGRRREGLGRSRPRVGPAARSKAKVQTLVARQPSRLDRRRPDVEGLRVAAPARAPIQHHGLGPRRPRRRRKTVNNGTELLLDERHVEGVQAL